VRLQGIVPYIAVGIAMAILMVVWALCMVFWRYCCCCCCKRSQRCKCGGKYPTRKTLWVGYSIQSGHKFGYSTCGRVATLIYLMIFLGLVGCVARSVRPSRVRGVQRVLSHALCTRDWRFRALVAVGELRGNQMVTKALDHLVVNTGAGAMSVVRRGGSLTTCGAVPPQRGDG
jgi:hypothetical protein